MPRQNECRIRGGDGRPMRAIVTLPEDRPTSRPGLVITHEIFGLRDDMRAIALRFAENGYASVIPDLFDRPEPRPLCILRAARSMARREGREFDDLHAARDYLGTLSEVDGARIGIVGFCFGGGFAVALAPSGDYRVSAPFYGQVPTDGTALTGACPSWPASAGETPGRGAQDLALLATSLNVVYPMTSRSIPRRDTAS